ncbi:MAG: cell envelope integrity protein CreD [Colwellia sp.]|nr:cell envelope integrity protein CreD [Colwellia sp.]
MQTSLSIKLAIIAFVTVLLLIPLNMISGKIIERSQFLEQAKNSVSQSWTGKQKVMSALIVIPYNINHKVTLVNKVTKEKTIHVNKVAKQKFVIPDKINIVSTIVNEVRSKGIYKIPVYTTKLEISGTILQSTLQAALKIIEKEANGGSIGTPYLTTTVSDPRGINSIPTLQWQDKQVSFKPGSKLLKNHNGLHAYLPGLNESTSELIRFKFQLELRGMEEISFIPIGKEAEISVSSTWPHPQFIGSFLPISREISKDGYQAVWKITSFASNITDKINKCENGSCDALFSSHFGVKHIEAVDVYLQSERSVKYGMLFIGLSFITFFIFEVIMKLPIHPIQYTLVGFAIATFYLLLISLSEHINFLLAYIIASVCCTSLLLFYLRYVLAGYKQALAFSGILLILYSVLYVIISAEDLALVMGAILTFTSLAIVMFATRNINWYQVGEQLNDKQNEPQSAKED